MEIFACPIIFDRLYKDYSQAIRRRIAAYIKDEDAAADVLQETFLKVWNKMPTYDPSRGSVFSWLNTIAVSASIDYLRRVKARMHDVEGVDKISDLSDDRSHPDKYLLLHEMTRLSTSLAPDLYKVVVMIYFRGYTQEEAARILQLPLGTVKSRQRRALQIMRIKYRLV